MVEEIPEYIKLCNCAGCSCELLGLSMLDWWDSLSRGDQRRVNSLLGKPRFASPFVHKYFLERPYCKDCSRLRETIRYR